MATTLNQIDADLWRAKVDQSADTLMRAKAGTRQLQVLRFARAKEENWEDETCSVASRDIEDDGQLESLREETGDCSHVFVVRQRRSWESLNISRELLDSLFEQWSIFPLFWRFIIPLGKKNEENEFEYPGFRTRRTVNADRELGDRHESAYILRRAELHNYKVVEGQPLYSIRQTAVYHSWTPGSETTAANSSFLLVAPSRAIESCLEHHIDRGTTSQQAIAPWNFHRLLIADSLRGWMEYMASLYEELRKLSDLIAVTPIGNEKEGFSSESAANLEVNFVTRQNLKLTDDCIIDMQVILQTLLSTITDVRAQCKKFRQSPNMSEEEKADLELAIGEFGADVKDVEMLSKRAKFLREKVTTTSQLLADLLNYEDAVALKNMAEESQKESKSMHCLTEISTRDSAAVKILTIITLVYLPTTIVANFFSTELVYTADDGKLKLAPDAWLLAAIAIPLTTLTLVVWWAWLYCTRASTAPLTQVSVSARIQRQPTFGSFRSWSWKKGSRRDLEMGGFAGRERGGSWRSWDLKGPFSLLGSRTMTSSSNSSTGTEKAA